MTRIQKIRRDVLEYLYYFKYLNKVPDDLYRIRSKEILEDIDILGYIIPSHTSRSINKRESILEGIDTIIHLFKSLKIVEGDNNYCDRIYLIISKDTTSLDVLQSFFEAYILTDFRLKKMINLFTLVNYFQFINVELHLRKGLSIKVPKYIQWSKKIMEYYANNLVNMDLTKFVNSTSIDIESAQLLFNFIKKNQLRWEFLHKIYQSYININHSKFTFKSEILNLLIDGEFITFQIQYMKNISWNSQFIRTDFTIKIFSEIDPLLIKSHLKSTLRKSQSGLWNYFKDN